MDGDLIVGSKCPFPAGAEDSSTAKRGHPHSFQFVVTTVAGKPSAKEKKVIRSHVARGKGRPRQGSAVRKPLAKLWVNRTLDNQSPVYTHQTQNKMTSSSSYPSQSSTLISLNPDTSQAGDSESEAQLSTASVMRSLSFVPGMDAPTLTKIFDSEFYSDPVYPTKVLSNTDCTPQPSLLCKPLCTLLTSASSTIYSTLSGSNS